MTVPVCITARKAFSQSSRARAVGSAAKLAHLQEAARTTTFGWLASTLPLGFTIIRDPSASPPDKKPNRAISSSGGGSQDHFRLGTQPHWRLSSALYSARFRAAIAASITGTPVAFSTSL